MFRQGTERHCSYVRIGFLRFVRERPATVRILAAEYVVDVGCLYLVRAEIFAIEGNQRPYCAVNTLPNCLVIVEQRRGEVIAADVLCILANRCEREDNA